MTEQTPVQTGTQDQQVVITRLFDAPRRLVFDAWTQPDQVARWWGPEGFDTPLDTVEIDLRVGGRFHLRMVQGRTGAQYPLRYEILELVAPELLVLKSEPMPEMGMHEPTITRVELHDEGGGTRMTLTDGPYTASSHAEQGWNGAFGKLDRMLSAVRR
jgi:uncharacterized protein YndB with AHSA1/START domain